MTEPSPNDDSDELRRHTEDPAEGAEPGAATDHREDVLREHPEGPSEG